MERTRDYRFDNTKTILLFFVLWGHMLYRCPEQITLQFYRIIYAFHMPVFIIIAGYFAKFNRQRILLNFLPLYIFFQLIYQLLDSVYLDNHIYDQLQFTSPHWIMWYIFVVIVYYISIPLLETSNQRFQIIIFIICTLISLLLFTDNSIGYYLSIGRIIYFYPYFVFGFYLSKNKEYTQKSRITRAITLIAVVLSVCYIFNTNRITYTALYGVFSYEVSDYTCIDRLFLMLFAITCFFLFINILPNKKIPVFTQIGQNPLPVYLLHGFVILIIEKHQLFHFSAFENITLSFLLSILLLIILGNKYVAKAFNYIFQFKWIHPLIKK